MEATTGPIPVVQGATIEFLSEEEPEVSGGGATPLIPSKTRYFCILRVNGIKVMIEFQGAPRILGDGPTFEHETAQVIKLQQWAYGEDNPVGVAVPGWGTGSKPDTDPPNDWESTLETRACKPYTELLQSSSLEKLVEKLAKDASKLRHDYLLWHFRVVLARYLLFPSDEEFEEILKEHMIWGKPPPTNHNPIFCYVQDELERVVTDENRRKLVQSGLLADLRCGFFTV